MTSFNTSGQFLEESASIDASINTIQANIDQIQMLQTKILNCTTSQMEDALNQERSTLMTNTKNLMIEIKNRIKKIDYENSRLPKNDPNNNLRTQQHSYLQDKFKNVLDEYRGIEDNYMQLQKTKISRQYKIVNPAATEDEIDDYVSNPSDQPLFQNAVLHSGEARSALAEVQKRHGDIKQIESTIAELVSLFHEMQFQVESQDPTLTNIEESVDETTKKLEQATIDIEEAHKSSTGARRKKWIFFGVIVLVILIIIAVIVTQLPKQTNVTSTVPASNVVTVTASGPSRPSPSIT